ncbi:prepilin-type N-terminal cleavage/methylation domain-containing protein [Wenzhouxiangella sp. AB-CW3]|uniref:pilus assembly FimT family protein n=1 Tax=Wenzhouxiangella sp. AB-CW3 TaxID=2771012 RepID=UPI00168AEFAE|nr:prepilin-type N-terminal cleavage/methylation domain-containing protein [Wenzhouxiangella sp. AB-CW3]QOC22170.1 prepilin-type N-terminal cleavage/methylation domain-containing protein [Wenzhouxiangella sp. AB-CW3]
MGRRSLRQDGMSLVELAIAMSVVGLLIVGVLTWLVFAQNQRIAQAERELMVRAEIALVDFVYQNHRLPRPAAGLEGHEVGPGSDLQKGQLPWRTLGLADAAAGQLRYGVYRQPNEALPAVDRDLAVARDRFIPLQAGELSDFSVPTGSSTLVDFCYALDLVDRMRDGVETDFLHTDNGNGQRQQIAYALAAPGRALRPDFDGSQPSPAPVFDPPSRRTGPTYSDQVAVASFAALSAHLDCERGLSAIGHTHFNAAASARMMERAMADYYTLKILTAVSASAGVASGVATVATSAAGIVQAGANLAQAIATAIGTVGGASGLIAIAVADIVTNTAVTVVAAASLALAITNLVVQGILASAAGDLASDFEVVADAIEASAVTADERGY